MNRIYSQINQPEGDTPIFNAYARERFFYHDDLLSNLSPHLTPIDKATEIEEMLSANITRMTRHSQQDN